MKAMILAAGLGTRLRPLTDDRCKALVEVGGRTMLELALDRLRALGIREVCVNTHHFADKLEAYLRQHENFGLQIEVFREELLLDTGGGLKNAAPFFLRDDAMANEPFLLHNVDVVSNIDLAAMVRFHVDHDALATLAVQDRTTSRYLLFDELGQLCGRRAGRDGEVEMLRSADETTALAFSGIHILSPRIFAAMEEEGAFSIIPAYLRLAAQGEKILAYRADGAYWRDLGKPESVAQVAREIKSGLYTGF